VRALPGLLTALVLALAAPAAPAQQEGLSIPKNDGWVTDLAGLLSTAEERDLETLMESYRQGTSHEIALLTIPSLQGESIDRFALEVGRAWGLGTKEKNNGALLVVSKADRKIRIEVGRGLEGSLTDSISGRIIRNVIAPEFKRGRFGPGLKAGVVAIHEAIGGNYGKIPSPSRSGGSGLAGLIPIFVFVFILIAVLARRGGRGRGFGGSMLPWWMLMNSGAFGGRSRGGGSWGGGGGGGGFSGGGFGGFGGGGGFSGGGASGGW
jgi:uncharacterized protein